MYYRDQIPDEVIELYVFDLKDLDFESVRIAYEKYRRNPRNTRAPLPAAIREIISPLEDPRTMAIDASNRIVAAIAKHGYTWNWPRDGKWWPHHSFQDACIAEVGELGWDVIQRMGGWLAVHDEWKREGDGIFKAQLRDLAEAAYKRAANGHRNTPPGLPGVTQGNRLLSVGQIMKGQLEHEE